MRDGLLPRIPDWPAFLEAWGIKARARRRKGAPTVITTFAGAGGSSTGYRMAGFRVLAATDFWERAAETYRAVWPRSRYLVADITKLNPTKLMDFAEVGSGELDILDGSPPCQGFSLAGKRQLDDQRNALFLDFCRLLSSMQPKIFVMENVGGLVGGSMRMLFREMTRALAAEGYNVACRMIDASWLGVPQKRKRLFWIGIRDDLEIDPVHPVPRYRTSSVREAIGDLIGAIAEVEDVVMYDSYPKPPKIDAPGPSVRAGRTRQLHAPHVIDKWKDRNRHYVASQNSVRLDADRPSNTVNGNGPPHWSPWVPYQLGPRENSRLQSFPDWYEFKGNKGEQLRQIGNAVPPLMMAHIAAAIGESVLGFPARYVDPMKT